MIILKWTLLTSAILGTIAFLVGFVGPIVFYPESNQGPLLGIFLTGPLGIVAGAIIGACVGVFKASRSAQIPRRPAFPVIPRDGAEGGRGEEKKPDDETADKRKES